MAGLNNLLSDTQQTTTTMPAWYDQAQQSIMNQGTAALGAAPTFGQTTAQGAVNTLQGPANPFTQAQTSLGQIASGAANPWITDASGNVTPNTSTAMGGLFKAQQQELNQLLPEYTAPTEASAIASGNFGSLRGQTAVDKARADAFAKLNAAQLQAALSNQQVGATAGAGLGNVGQQGINAAMNVGQAQMNAPFTNVSNYANLLGSMQAPTTTTSQVQMSPLTQAATLANTIQGTGVTGGLGTLLFGKPASGSTAATSGLLGNLGNSLSKSLGFGTSPAGSNTSGGYGTGQGGSGLTPNPDGTFTNSNGDILNANGDVITRGNGPDYNAGSDTNNQPIPDYTGPAITDNPTNMGSADYTDQGYGGGV
jgi:hypothetical protein